jgi:hypothetical protein
MNVSVPDDPMYPPAHKKTDLEKLIRAKRVRPLQSIDELAADIWESDEELDEFLRFVYASRRGDLA